MASKFAQGIFNPKNPAKYVGKGTIRYRSGWELTAFNMIDQHPSILQWASESIVIPYIDKATGKKKNYIPDLFLIYKDKNGVKKAEIVEIKPSSQTGQNKPKNLAESAVIMRNLSKWSAASAYAAKNGMTFRVITEKDLFGQKGK
jgi:hypothetical protein